MIEHIEYDCITAGSAEDLKEKVNALLKLNKPRRLKWDLHGPTIVTGTMFVQAMRKSDWEVEEDE